MERVTSVFKERYRLETWYRRFFSTAALHAGSAGRLEIVRFATSGSGRVKSGGNTRPIVAWQGFFLSPSAHLLSE